MDKKYYDEKIRKIPNFPKEGILFYDITTLLEDPRAFQSCIDDLYDYFKFDNIDKVVGIDARGFLLASTLAYKLGAGVSIVRKKGKLPYKTKSSQYEKEYGSDTLEMHEDAIKPEEKVFLPDPANWLILFDWKHNHGHQFRCQFLCLNANVFFPHPYPRYRRLRVRLIYLP